MALIVANCPFSSSSPHSMLAKGGGLDLRERARSFGLPLSFFATAKPRIHIHRIRKVTVFTAFLFDPNQKPILKEALKEPIAFMGGMFAGLLKLDLNEDPLKEWITRSVEASGITEEEIGSDDAQPEEEEPQQIEIE